MTQDPIVKEVREIRHQIDEECVQDPEKYYRYLQKLQKKLAKRLVCRQPNPLPVSKQNKGVKSPFECADENRQVIGAESALW